MQEVNRTLVRIGLAIARRLGKDGASVVVSSRKQANVDNAVADLKNEGYEVMGLTCHVSKEEDRTRLMSETVKKYGGIDILVSNAATNPVAGGVLDCPEGVWDKIMDVNVKSALLLTKLVIPYMEQRRGGSIVYVSSIAGFQPIDVVGAYSVSKTALLGLTKAVAQEIAGDNIRVNCVAPGIIRTKFSAALHSNEYALEKVLERIPMGRLGESHEMAGLVSFLCSDDASYITGESFIAAGGMASRL
ncbi:dehydrogenase/reductase SDR family member 4-like isoform X2 [Oratosquilla oratoria]|uniref:dehydrogenase/reductase SDR family member 4-like isoform X2 n=1 Tax=Oratosquilla oratoria TaxID=337810 RepID=UPI003F757BCB